METYWRVAAGTVKKLGAHPPDFYLVLALLHSAVSSFKPGRVGEMRRAGCE